MDTKFVSQLLNVYSNFSKVPRKESFRFPEDVLEVGVQKNSFLQAEQFYFPLNLEKTHWVGICVDMISWSLSVLDCNLSIKSDYMMNKEVRPIAQMFPYFAKQVGKHVASIDGNPLRLIGPNGFLKIMSYQTPLCRRYCLFRLMLLLVPMLAEA